MVLIPPQGLVLLFLLTFSYLFSCYSSMKEGPLPLHHHDHFIEEVVSDPQAYPFSYFSTIEDDNFEQEDDSSRLGMVEFMAATSVKVFSVDDFGATADGDADDTKAFEKGWMEACSTTGSVVLQVPQGNTYLLKPVTFSGPCKSNNITIEILGSIEASDNMSDYKDNRHWLQIQRVNNLLVEGGGNINGNGEIWWQNSCKVNKDLPCKHAPTALTFNNCKNVVVRNLSIQDAQQIHLVFDKCTNVQAANLTVTAPERSPNTDGIHVSHTKNIQILNCVIGTGDDCISIVSGSQNVQATDITCGPGHGISIGSLGNKNSKAYVSKVIVDGAKISNTTNGVRIKTWQGGSGIASDIIFQNIDMFNVTNPIIIDQNYCDQDKPCKEQSSAVQVKNVGYNNIGGTSASRVAIKFDCSKTHPCQDILLRNIDLQEQGDEIAKAVCKNIKLSEEGIVSPQCP